MRKKTNHPPLKTKRFFTFLELFICLTIITLLGSILGWQSKKLIDSHRFEHAAFSLIRELRHLQLLSLTHQADLCLELYYDKNDQLFYTVSSDETIPILQMMHPVPLTGIDTIRVKNKRIKSYHFDILSSGRIVPELVLKLYHDSHWIGIDCSSPLQIKPVRSS